MPADADRRDAVYAARPTLRFGGEEDRVASELLQSLRMEEGEGGLRSLGLVLSNWASTADNDAGPAFPDGRRLRLGAAIEVYVGDQTEPREVFRGTITAVEERYRAGNAPEIAVLAEDALQRARLARRSRTFRDRSPADVVRAVAAELGLQPVIAGLTAPVATWVQLDETDLAFLRRLLARFDADLQVVGEDIHVSPRGDVARGRVGLNALTDLHWLEVGADLAEQVTSVSVRGWDEVAGRAVLGEASAMTHPGPGTGRDGARLLREAFGERPDNLGHLAARSREEAVALAQAAFDHRARRFVRARGATEGNPRLRVGTTLGLSGTGERFDNDYYVTRTVHRFDLDEGYRTEFEAECARIGGSR